MAAKLHTTKRISLQGGSAATGKTVPGPKSVRGGGQTASQTSGSGKATPSAGTGFGNARGMQKGRGC